MVCKQQSSKWVHSRRSSSLFLGFAQLLRRIVGFLRQKRRVGSLGLGQLALDSMEQELVHSSCFQRSIQGNILPLDVREWEQSQL